MVTLHVDKNSGIFLLLCRPIRLCDTIAHKYDGYGRYYTCYNIVLAQANDWWRLVENPCALGLSARGDPWGLVGRRVSEQWTLNSWPVCGRVFLKCQCCSIYLLSSVLSAINAFCRLMSSLPIDCDLIVTTLKIFTR